MLPKKLIGLIGFIVLAIAGAGSLRAQWVLSVNALTSVGDDVYAGIDAAPQASREPSYDGVLRSTDHGESWYGIGLKRTSIYALASSGGNLIASAGYYTQDFGKTWTQTNGLDGPMAFCVKDSTVFAGADGVFRSTDHGANWQRVFIDTTILANGLYSMASNGSDIFAGGDYFYGSTGIYRSIDNGATWMNIGPDSKGVLAIATIGSKLVVGAFGDFPGAILISSDTGRTWVNKLAVDADVFAQSGSYLFAGTSEHGIFVSSDTGERWSNILVDTNVTSLAVSGNYLVAGTWWGNIFRFAISDLIASSGVTEESIAQGNILVYPNPVTSATTISFTAVAATHADITLVNLLGAEVAQVFSGMISSGTQRFRWEPTGLPDGLYECLLRMNGQVEKLPVLLLH